MSICAPSTATQSSRCSANTSLENDLRKRAKRQFPDRFFARKEFRSLSSDELQQKHSVIAAMSPLKYSTLPCIRFALAIVTPYRIRCLAYSKYTGQKIKPEPQNHRRNFCKTLAPKGFAPRHSNGKICFFPDHQSKEITNIILMIKPTTIQTQENSSQLFNSDLYASRTATENRFRENKAQNKMKGVNINNATGKSIHHTTKRTSASRINCPIFIIY